MKMAITRNHRLVAWVEEGIVNILKEYYSLFHDYYVKHGYRAFRRV